jgi:hypothetical protein
MASYRLFKSPEGELVRVTVGFSWQAFFVGSFRTFIRRTWPVLCLLPVAYFVFARKGGQMPTSSRLFALLFAAVAAYVCYMAFCGIYGNRWLVRSLLRRGFRQIGEEAR